MDKVTFDSIYSQLGPRQLQVLDLFLMGKKDEEISSALYIAKETVRKHISDINFAFLGADRRNTRIELMHLCTQHLNNTTSPISPRSSEKFFMGKPISIESIEALCKPLELDREEIAESEGTVSSVSNRKRVVFVIEGSLDDLDSTKLAKLQAMVRALQKLTGDASMTVISIEEGSVRLILEGSEEGIEKLKQLFNKGELAAVFEIAVTDVEPIESDALSTEHVREDCLKDLLISTIRSQGALKSDLSGADLSGADLSGADLSEADLSNANLRRANLRGSNLRSAKLNEATLSYASLNETDMLCTNFNHAHLEHTNLSDAKLRGVDLSYADLSYADLSYAEVVLEANLSYASLSDANLSYSSLNGVDLSYADLRGANLRMIKLSGTIVTEAQFGRNTNLTDELKIDLKKRGAKFEDSPGDRALATSGSPV